MPKSKYFVYMLECGDGSYYTGITTDIKRRVATHAAGKGGRYTRSRLPVRLIWNKAVKNVSMALKRERQIKSLTRVQKEKLVSAK